MGRDIPWRRTFSLIELIVCVAITLILTSMVISATQVARSKARGIQCAGQLRQMGMAASDYTDEYDGMLFPAVMDAPYGHWLNYVYVEDFQKNEKMLQCPVLDEDDMFNPYAGDNEYGDIRSASYIMNVIREKNVFGWSHMGAEISTDYSHSFGWTQGDSRQGVKKDRIDSPESKIFITDSSQELVHSSTAIGILRLHETDHGIIDKNGNHTVNSGERQVGFHHQAKFNALFGDLHVESRKLTDHEEWNAYQE